MTMPLPYSLAATYYRTALLLGLIQDAEVHRWAERVIERESEVPHSILDVVSTAPGDLSGLRIALWPLVVEPEPLPILRAMFALLHADLDSKRRSVGDTVAILRQMRSMLRLPAELYSELNAVLVEQSGVATAIPEWLRQFADEHRAMANLQQG